MIRGIKSGATRLSLPRSASPRKNLLNGSPRRSAGRSAGPISSPLRNVNIGTPSHVPVNRTLDFSVDKPQKAAPLPRTKLSRSTNGVKRGKHKGPFDLSLSDEEEEEEEEQGVNESIDPSLIQKDRFEDSAPEIDDGPIDDQTTMQSIEEDEQSFLQNEPPAQEDDVNAGAVAPSQQKSKRGGRPSRATAVRPAKIDESQVSLPASKPGRRGRPPKKTEVYQDAGAAKAQPLKTTGGGKRKQVPTERDPNARPKSAKTGKRSPSRAGSIVPRAGAYTVPRSETPATDGGAFTTRSGRTSIKPLASWRGEKAIFGQRPTVDSLPAMQEVVRTDEVMPPPRRRIGGYRPAKRKPRSQVLEEIEEEEEEVLEPWETDTGIQHAMVMQWNPDIGKYDEDNTEQLGMFMSFCNFLVLSTGADGKIEIAYAADAIEMRDIQGATFKFAKTLTLPFFGSGMVHLPPGGEKRVKNSRKMQMVFFVYYGRVTVNVGTPTTTFSIGTGGQWQVPRGKASLFFLLPLSMEGLR